MWLSIALPRSIAMDNHSISHWRSLGSCRRSAVMRQNLCKKLSVRSTNTWGLKSHRLDFVGPRNAQVIRTLPPICVSSSLAGTEGGPNQIAGRKRVNADDIPEQTLSAGVREMGDIIRSLAIFSQLQSWQEACCVDGSLNSVIYGMVNTTAASQWMQTEFACLCATSVRMADGVS